ncbi:MAG: N-acetyltransferase [Sphingomonadaceae bacterium]|nr:N-acetyltransferase [Sphingomonadaceae bacterium]
MIELRAERPDDRGAVLALVHQAFSASERGHTGEAELVDMLDEDCDLIFSHVAESDGKIVGHIALSPMRAKADGAPIRALGLGPVAALPGRQRRGIGSALVAAAHDWAAKEGWQMIFLLGDPRYYSRFGYSVDAAQPFASPYAGPYWQAILLDDSLTLPKAGKADYAPAFARSES